MDNKYAPIHENARAILRLKTILGETYVQLTPGTPNSPAVPDGGLLPRGQVTNAVQLSDIFDALDPKTRAAFRSWQQQLAKAIQGNDQNLNDVIGNLPQFAADAIGHSQGARRRARRRRATVSRTAARCSPPCPRTSRRCAT